MQDLSPVTVMYHDSSLVYFLFEFQQRKQTSPFKLSGYLVVTGVLVESDDICYTSGFVIVGNLIIVKASVGLVMKEQTPKVTHNFFSFVDLN